jgi:NAD(P)-dependent dehydrogenase (short-subunit alcohol dehydrogenase family)
MQLQNSTVMVTGASRGLGRALAVEFARRGAKLVLTARDADALAATASELRSRGAEVYALDADMSDKRSIYPLVGAATALAGPIDVLINNASTLGPSTLQLLLDTDCEDVERTLAVNLLAPFRLTKALLGAMLVRDRGVVVNVSSDAAHEPYPSWGAYGASKAALDQLSRIWANELGDSAVRILSVDPGEMDTAMHAQAMPDSDRDALAQPTDVARSIADMIECEALAPNGARLLAARWGAA